MKFASLAIALLFAAQAHATSLYYGPYISKTVGNNVCTVTPSSVIKIVNGKKTGVEVNFNAKEMEKAINAAAKGELKTTGLHMVETKPNIEIQAGVTPKLGSVKLYVDAGDIKTRTGKDARDLINQANSVCGSLK